jgi:hypothetical protein
MDTRNAVKSCYEAAPAGSGSWRSQTEEHALFGDSPGPICGIFLFRAADTRIGKAGWIDGEFIYSAAGLPKVPPMCYSARGPGCCP